MLQLYELTYLISSELNEQGLSNFQEEVNSLIASKGKIIRQRLAKRMTLAYPIKKRQEAFLQCLDFEAEPQASEDLKKELAKMDKILRFLLIKKAAAVSEKPKPRTGFKDKTKDTREKVKLGEDIEKEVDKILKEQL